MAFVRLTSAGIAILPIRFGYVAFSVMWSPRSLLGQQRLSRRLPGHITSLAVWMDKEPLNDAGVPVIVRWDAPTTA